MIAIIIKLFIRLLGLPDRREKKRSSRKPAATPVDDDVEDDNSVEEELEDKVSESSAKTKVQVRKVNEQPAKGTVKGYDPNR